MLRDIRNKIIRKAQKRIYFFDENGIYKSMPINNVAIEKFGNSEVSKSSTFCTYIVYFALCCRKNFHLVKKSISLLNEGDTIDTLEKYLNEIEFEYHAKPEGIERFIIRIDKPIFVRETGNIKQHTFDFIYVDVYIISKAAWGDQRNKFLKDNLPEIISRVIDKVRQNSSFKKYNIPFNFLNLSTIHFVENDIVRFVFELKKISE